MELHLNQTEMFLFYERIGSSWFTDITNTFLTAPLGFSGFVLNLFSFYIFTLIKVKQTKLYKYLRVYSLNGSMLCLVSGLSFLCASPRYTPFYLVLPWRIFRAYFNTMIFTTNYSIAVLFDILIAFDRLSIFYNRLQKVTRFKPNLMICLIIFFSIFINLPIGFSYYVKSEDEILYELKHDLSSFVYNGRTAFFYSQIGTIITYIQIFIRDILTLIVEIITSSVAFYFIRNVNLKRLNINTNLSRVSIFANTNTSINSTVSKIIRKKQSKDRRLLSMNLVLNVSSTISHLIVMTSYVYASKGTSMQFYIWLTIGYFGHSLKNFSNIFIFYLFDLNFKNKLNNLFSRSKK